MILTSQSIKYHSGGGICEIVVVGGVPRWSNFTCVPSLSVRRCSMDSLAFLSDMNYCPSNFFHCGRLYNLKVKSILLRSKSVDESIYLAFFIVSNLLLSSLIKLSFSFYGTAGSEIKGLLSLSTWALVYLIATSLLTAVSCFFRYL